MQKLQKVALVLLVLAGFLVILFWDSLSEIIKGQSGDSRPVRAEILEVFGGVETRIGETLQTQKTLPGANLKKNDTLLTSEDGRAKIRVGSQVELEIQPLSQMVVEEYGTATLLSFVRGSYKLLKGASESNVLVSVDGSIRDPSGRSPIPVFSVTEKDIQFAPPDGVVPKEEIAPPSGETLSDEYITSVLRTQKTYFTKCYAQHLQKSPTSRGSLFVTFLVKNTGEVEKVRVVKSSFKDPDLERCIVDVIRRSRFKDFTGEPILVNFPFSFE